MICLQLLYTQSWKSLALVTVPVLVNYCQQHDYAWNIQCITEPYDGFEKIRQVLKCFETKGCEVVGSFDCDSLITNTNIKVESILDADYDALFGKDINGLNCGIFFITKSEWSINFLKTLLRYKGQEGMECEQNAVHKYIEENGMDRIKITDGFNDYPLELYAPSYGKWNYKDGDIVEKPINEWNDKSFIMHTPGLTYETRLFILKSNTQHD